MSSYFFSLSSFSCSVGNVSSGSGLVNVDVIVLDEVHYLSDISRGTVWEEIVSMIYCLSCFAVFAHDLACLISLNFVCICFVLLQVIYCPKAVQLICLSATVANPDELAGWIGQVFRLGWSCLLQLQNLLRIEHLILGIICKEHDNMSPSVAFLISFLSHSIQLII